MQGKAKNLIFTFLKLLIYMSIACFVFGLLFVIIFDIIRTHHVTKSIGFYLYRLNIYSLLGFIIIWCLFSTSRYMKKIQIISQDSGEEAEALFMEIKNELLKMKWKITKEDSFTVFLKLPLIKSVWKEELRLELVVNSIKISGSKIYVEKVLKKVGYEMNL